MKKVPFLSVIFIKIQIHCHVIDHCFIFIFIHHGKNDHSIYKKSNVRGSISYLNRIFTGGIAQ